MDEGPDAAVLAALVVGGVLAAGNAIGIRFTLDELDPLWGAGFRFAIAALLLGTVVVVRRDAWPSGRALAGGLLAVAGVGLVSRAALDVDVPALAILSGLASVTCFALGAFAVRHLPRGQAVVMNTVSMAVGGVTLVVLAVVTGESITLPTQARTWLAFGYLVVPGFDRGLPSVPVCARAMVGVAGGVLRPADPACRRAAVCVA